MYWALGSPVLDKWTTGRQEMDIVLKAEGMDSESHRLETLLQLPCTHGGLPLSALVEVQEQPQLGNIYHRDRTRIVDLSVLIDRKYQRELLRTTQSVLAGFSFPTGYRGEIGKSVEERRLLVKAVVGALVLAILLIFFILMFQFESLPIAGFIILQIPGAFIFPILLLKILSWPVTLPVIVGLILTSGIAVNNGILVFAKLGKGVRLTVTKIHTVLEEKIRPIVVSSLTTIVGIAPLLLSGQANRGILAPLSITIASGIAGSMGILFLSLVIVAVNE
jgi:HAE1 family hydrophobic/amphiphilic exporter-1